MNQGESAVEEIEDTGSVLLKVMVGDILYKCFTINIFL